jgi:menaquinone-dependent protoporphyrinogen oxidase
VQRLGEYDAVIVGGALYANGWAPAVRRFVRRCERGLRRVPTWFFSSGPLDESANDGHIPPTKQVQVLMERVGALGHVTFGGRLTADAKGFPASAMAKKHAGDWRDRAQIQAWAADVARALPTATPGTPVAQSGRSWGRVALYGALGWAACASVMLTSLRTTSFVRAALVRALAVTIVFVLLARRYFGARGAREPLTIATSFALTGAVLDLALVQLLWRDGLGMFGSVVGFWLPLTLIFCVTTAVGTISSTLPVQPRGAPARAADQSSNRSLGANVSPSAP